MFAYYHLNIVGIYRMPEYEYGIETFLSSGRWGGSLYTILHQGHSSPYLFLILGGIWISLSAVFLIKLLEIENTFGKLSLIPLIVSPILVSPFFYGIDGSSYFLAFFLEVLASYVFLKKSGIVKYLIPILLISFATSIINTAKHINLSSNSLKILTNHKSKYKSKNVNRNNKYEFPNALYG